MAITTPIIGTDEAPSSPVYYKGLSSIDVRSFSTDAGLSSIDAIKSVRPVPGFSSLIVEAETTLRFLQSINIENQFITPSFQSLEVVTGDSFTILADILAEILSGPSLGSFAYMDINAELKVNDVIVPIKSFNYQVPTGKLGSILNVVLAIPDATQVPNGASIKFSLFVIVGGVESEYGLIDNGKLQERSYVIDYTGGKTGGPQDTVSFSSLDVISDKFGLAPRRSVTMFDPYRVRLDSVQTRNDQMVRDEFGNRILPILEPVSGLRMKQVIARAYTGMGGNSFLSAPSGPHSWDGYLLTPETEQQGTGFLNVVTNIIDYPVRRADFTLQSGWHDGAQPVVAMYTPIYFVHDNILYIMDVDAPLPDGMSPHPITLDDHKTLTEKLSFKPDVNAILLTYQYSANDPSEDPGRQSRDVFHDPVIDETGTSGTPGYSKVTVRRWDREFFMLDAPDAVLDTLPLSSDTETISCVVWRDSDGNVTAAYDRVTHQETVTYQYDGELKIHHERIVKAWVADPGTAFFIDLITVEQETTDISWVDDPNNPGVKLQFSVRTDLEQVCVWGPDQETVSDGGTSYTFNRMVPVLEAFAAGIVVDNTWKMGPLIPTKSIRETLQNMKGQHFDVEVVETDYINNTLKRSYVAPTTGTVSASSFDAKSRSILFCDLESEADIGPRIPIPLNTYELPRLQAIALAHRVLGRIKNPLMSLPIILAGVDFTIAQGSVIKGQKRAGYTTNYFVTGYAITGTSLGKKGHRIAQTLEATELLTV